MPILPAFSYRCDPVQGYQWDVDNVPKDARAALQYVDSPAFRRVQNGEHLVAPASTAGRFVHVVRKRVEAPDQRPSVAYLFSVASSPGDSRTQLRTLYTPAGAVPRPELVASVKQITAAALALAASQHPQPLSASAPLAEIAAAFARCAGEEAAQTVGFTLSPESEAPSEGLHVFAPPAAPPTHEGTDPEAIEILHAVSSEVEHLGDCGLAEAMERVFQETGERAVGARDVPDLRARLRLSRQLADVAAGLRERIDLAPLHSIRGGPRFKAPDKLPALERLVDALLPLTTVEHEGANRAVWSALDEVVSAAADALFFRDPWTVGRPPGEGSATAAHLARRRRLFGVVGHAFLRSMSHEPDAVAALRGVIDGRATDCRGLWSRFVSKWVRRSRRRELDASARPGEPEDEALSAFLALLWTSDEGRCKVAIPGALDRVDLADRVVALACAKPVLSPGLARELLDLVPATEGTPRGA